MTTRKLNAAAIFASLVLCAGTAAAQQSPPPGSGVPITGLGAAGRPVNPADLHFMQGMIPHHAQAVLIAGWAKSHGANADVQRLCERIVVGQRDEISLMQNWLRDRHETVPDANATHMQMQMQMDGMTQNMLMPGMLTDPELAALDKTRGVDFDRMFLQSMMRHHQGAISMVDELFASPGAGQDEVVFRFASDVYADQTTEIDRMQQMLDKLPPPKGGL
jgi:uncharacterized protein (DUF305 family)